MTLPRKCKIIVYRQIEIVYSRLVSIAQLVGQCIIIGRGRGSNPGHSTYSPYKVNSNH